jgi:hypothetical protein
MSFCLWFILQYVYNEDNMEASVLGNLPVLMIKNMCNMYVVVNLHCGKRLGPLPNISGSVAGISAYDG